MADYQRAEQKGNSAATLQLKAGAAAGANLVKDESATSLPSNQDPMNQDIFRGNMSNTFKEVQAQLARENETGQEKDESYVEIGDQDPDSFNILANSSGATKLVAGYKAQENKSKLTVDLGQGDYDQAMDSNSSQQH